MGLFFDENFIKKLCILLFFLTSQPLSIVYAMEQTDELVSQHSMRRSVVKSGGKDLNAVSHEDEETLPLLSARKENNKSWKKNWVVKNIIVEFPIIGDFFHEGLSITDSLKRAGKSTAMLVGGSIGMMLEPIPMLNDNMATHITKSTLNMAIGMWVAVSAYNTVLSLGNLAYQCCAPHQSSQGT